MDERLGKRGISPQLYHQLYLNPLRRDVVPDRQVVAEHPEYRAQRDVYLQIFETTFMGPVHRDAGLPEDWESLWMKAFAADPTNSEDYGPNERSPSWQVSIELDRYVTPVSATRNTD